MANAEGYYNRLKKRLDKNPKQDAITYLADHLLMGCCIIAEAIRNSGELNDEISDAQKKLSDI